MDADTMAGGMTADRLQDRRGLLAAFNNARRDLDHEAQAQTYLNQQARAFDLLSSPAAAKAFDVASESAKLRERYGNGQPYKYQFDGAPTVNEHLLLARRLIEAGVRVVTLSYGRWDSHSKNFDLVRDHFAALLTSIAAEGGAVVTMRLPAPEA